MPSIRTTYDPPPIPTWRQFAWSAIDDDTYDGAEDSSTRHQIGWGATEEEAIADLMEQIGADMASVTGSVQTWRTIL